MTTACNLSCVLFDLDGTLVDTSVDLIAALNMALAYHQFGPIEAERVKPYISYGAAAMIKYSVADSVSATVQSEILNTFLEYYQNNIAVHSALFDGMSDTLATIEGLGLRWGVITNKRERFTHPLMDALKLTTRAACIISGDTTEQSKPHPLPLLMGCEQVDVGVEACIFIGDARHDVAAGRAANMKTAVALYGFLKPDDKPEQWGADFMVTSPLHFNDWIKSTVCH